MHPMTTGQMLFVLVCICLGLPLVLYVILAIASAMNKKHSRYLSVAAGVTFLLAAYTLVYLIELAAQKLL